MMEGGIVVSSYIELYTQFLGWAVYNNIWSLVKESGLIFIPFIAIIWEGWMSSLEKSSFESVAAVSFRKIVMNNVVAMFVMLFAAEPVLDLNPSIVTYNRPQLQVFELGNVLSDTEVSIGNTGTTFDDAFASDVEAIESALPDLGVPILWAHTLNLGTGFSYGMMAGLPQKEDLRFLQNFMQSVFIDDPMLSNEISRFTTECYGPARSKFFRIKDEVPARLNANMVNDILERYPNDLNWMGSLVFSKSQGLYARSDNMEIVSDGYKARKPVSRFREDEDYPNARPYCDDWWTAIKQGIIDIAKNGSLIGEGVSDFDVLNSVITNAYDVVASEHITLDDIVDNYIVETYLRNTRQQLDMVPDDLAWSNTSYSANPDSISQGLAYGVKGALSMYGSAKEGAVWSVKFYTVLLALPMIQAVLIFGFIVVLPFLLVFTKLGIKGVVYGFMGFFTLKLLTGLWGIASWFDSTLIAVMYPDQSAIGAFFSGANNEGTERILLDMITTAMHLGLPVLFLGVMGIAGFQVGNVIGGAMQGESESTARAGESGGRSAVNNAEDKLKNKKP